MNHQKKFFDENDLAQVRERSSRNRKHLIIILDIPCCVIFLIFIMLFVVLSIFAFQEGIEYH